jgi:hypothetical protein
MRVKFYKNKLKCGNNELADGNFPRVHGEAAPATNFSLRTSVLWLRCVNEYFAK